MECCGACEYPENVLSRDIDGLATTVVDPNAYRDVVDQVLAKGSVVSFNNDDPGAFCGRHIGQFDYAAGATADEQRKQWWKRYRCWTKGTFIYVLSRFCSS